MMTAEDSLSIWTTGSSVVSEKERVSFLSTTSSSTISTSIHCLHVVALKVSVCLWGRGLKSSPAKGMVEDNSVWSQVLVNRLGNYSLWPKLEYDVQLTCSVVVSCSYSNLHFLIQFTVQHSSTHRYYPAIFNHCVYRLLKANCNTCKNETSKFWS